MKKKQTPSQRVRIIGGYWRSRLIDIVTQPGLRPSTDRVRETVFNWLTPFINDAKIIDLFAGTGVLGFEACSRGAQQVLLIEKNHAVFQGLKNNLDKLRPLPGGSDIQLACIDAIQWLSNQHEIEAKIIFLDPPFDQPELLEESLRLIYQRLKKDTHPIIYVESNAKLDNETILKHMPQWTIEKQLVAGVVKASILKCFVDQ
jgi:16S rRNA (guanine966-N2)-methyltransferase